MNPLEPLPPIMALAHAAISRGGKTILIDVNLTVSGGEIVAVFGPNGCGKSTLLMAVAGQLALDSGCLALFGDDVPNVSGAVCHPDVTFVPQTSYLYEGLSIRENIRAAITYAPPPSGEARQAQIAALWAREFPRIPLSTATDQLSSGEARFLSIVIGLGRGSRLIMLDEPSAGLSNELAKRAFQLIKGSVNANVAVILAEQRRDLAITIARSAIVIEAGVARREGAATASPGEVQG